MESMQYLMGQLADSTKRLTQSQLLKLSDLSSIEVKLFRQLWDGLGVVRRRKIITQLVAESEANIEFNFERVFTSCINDPDANVRAKAIEGLWECHETGLIGIFISLLNNDSSLIVRVAAAKALGIFVLLAELGKIQTRYTEQLETSLLKILEDKTKDIEVRQQALESISYFSQTNIYDAINNAYQSTDGKMKISSIRSMGRNLDSRWLKILLKELSNPEVDLRLEAARACGDLGDEKAVPELISRLEDENSQVQIAVIQSLGQIGGKRAINALSETLKHSALVVRIASQEALQEAQFSADASILPK